MLVVTTCPYSFLSTSSAANVLSSKARVGARASFWLSWGGHHAGLPVLRLAKTWHSVFLSEFFGSTFIPRNPNLASFGPTVLKLKDLSDLQQKTNIISPGHYNCYKPDTISCFIANGFDMGSKFPSSSTLTRLHDADEAGNAPHAHRRRC